MVGSQVKHSDSHSHGSRWGSQPDLSAERQREGKSLFNSSTPLCKEAEIKLMKSIRASSRLFLIQLDSVQLCYKVLRQTSLWVKLYWLDHWINYCTVLRVFKVNADTLSLDWSGIRCLQSFFGKGSTSVGTILQGEVAVWILTASISRNPAVWGKQTLTDPGCDVLEQRATRKGKKKGLNTGESSSLDKLFAHCCSLLEFNLNRKASVSLWFLPLTPLLWYYFKNILKVSTILYSISGVFIKFYLCWGENNFP